ncbi:MAG: glycoside hydrolase family 3 C-terminal domain-containing protein [Oscillospiraceae bacterium]
MAEYRFRDTALSFDERTKALLMELTLEEKLLLIHSRMAEIPRLGLKAFGIGTEVARGLVCRGNDFGEKPSTVFPEPFGMAAMFDANIMKTIGEVTGTETRIYNAEGKCSLAVWGPTVDMERDPRWGRNEEGYGEDPFLTGTMAAAFCKGMYGVNDKYARVIPTLKHFYANNHEEDRGVDNAVIPTCLKYDYYLKAFEKPVKEGNAYSLMTSYNEINGVEALCNPEIQSICKDKWGLLFAVTDGGDFIDNVQRHRHDKNHVDAIAKVYSHHGADIMTDHEQVVTDAAREALAQGKITEADIDKALYGVLLARFMLGEFDSDCPYNNTDPQLLCCDEYIHIAEKAAEKSVILLRNRNAVLPLSKHDKLAVIGYHADMNFRDWYTGFSEKKSTILDALTSEVGRENIIYESGNDVIALRNEITGFYFSVDNDGVLVCDSASINEACLLEVFEWGDGAVSFKSTYNGKFLSDCGVLKCCSDEPYGWFVKEKFNIQRNGNVCVMRNWQDRFIKIDKKSHLTVSESLKADSDSMLHIELFSSGADRVRRVVTEAHNAVYFCGNNPLINARETMDRKHLELPEKQKELFDVIITLNPNAVLFLVSGYPYAINDKRAASVMHITHAGPAMGYAVKRTLFGEVSPAGRCPVTWYSSVDELCDIKDYNIIRTGSTYLYYNGEPLFPFGYGLSYTTFRYGAVKTDKRTYEKDEIITAVLEVENVGGCDSEEVVQLYISEPKSVPYRANKRLKAFARVFVPRGEAVKVKLEINIADLALWNPNTRDYDVFSGEYEIQVGSSSADIRRTTDICIVGSEYEGLDITQCIQAVDCCDYLGVEYLADSNLEQYALINDWQSFMRFDRCIFKSYHAVEVVVSNPGSPAKLTFISEDTNSVVAECEIPSTGSLTEFRKVSASTEPITGTGRLRIISSGMLSLKSFKFI